MQGRINVFRSRFFWKLYLTFSGFFLFLCILIGTFVSYRLQETFHEEETQRLKEKISLLGPQIETFFEKGNDQSNFDFKSEFMSVRGDVFTQFTLLRPGDNGFDPTIPDKSGIKYYPEIRQALTEDYGISTRNSYLSGKALLIVAKVLRGQDGNVLGAIRASIPMDHLNDQVAKMRDSVGLIALLSVLFASGIGLVIARSITVPISEMMHVCDAMRRGDYDQQVKVIRKDEIGHLADTLNRLGAEMTRQIRAVSSERAQLKGILASMVEGIVSIDENEKIEFCNSAAYRLLGSLETDCRGKTIKEADGFKVLKPLIKKAKKAKGLVEKELKVGDAENLRRLECQANIIRADDHKGLIVVLHDVTDLKKLETVRRDFIANISHEIKTPLTSIRGYVETLLEGAIDDDKFNRKFCSKIDANAQRLHALVQDIISLSQIETQDYLPERTPSDWLPIIKTVLSRYEGNIVKKDLTVEVLNTVDNGVVLGDKEAMSQIFENLLTNAIRYTPNSGKIQVNFKRDQSDLILKVSDTGVGVPESDLARVFERFYRVDKARSRELGGTGLGLSIVRHLVQSMGGDVWLTSKVQAGSSFYVRLPVAH